MNKYYLKIQISLFLFLLICITSCNGQVKTNLPKDSIAKTETTTDGQPKMIRTQGVKSGNVDCELQDNDGNIWFCIGGEGVYRYDGKSFTNFTTKDGLCDNNVSSIIEDKEGNILFGTKSGICKYDPGSGSFTDFSEIETLSKTGDITCLLEDRNGNLWFGTLGNGIYRYNPASGEITNFLNNGDYPLNFGNRYQLIMDILEDKNGNLWFSSWNRGGVWRYDGKTFTNYLPSKNYYVSNEDGRTVNPSKQETISSFPPEITYSSSQDSITDDMIFSITEDKSGNLWFATRRHGACRYDGKSFTSFMENEGFVSYGIYSILEDKKGNMWFTTDKNGVFCYDGKTFKNYTTKDGLVNNSVFSILEDRDGNLWFGTRWFGLSR